LSIVEEDMPIQLKAWEPTIAPIRLFFGLLLLT